MLDQARQADCDNIGSVLHTNTASPLHYLRCQRRPRDTQTGLSCAATTSALLVVAACAGDLSRNRTVGLRLGKGESLEEITAGMKAVAEGILTSRAAHDLAAKLQVQAPIIDGIFRVIHQRADPVAVVTEVMSRRRAPPRPLPAAHRCHGQGHGSPVLSTGAHMLRCVVAV